jgi:hypothetical protein
MTAAPLARWSGSACTSQPAARPAARMFLAHRGEARDPGLRRAGTPDRLSDERPARHHDGRRGARLSQPLWRGAGPAVTIFANNDDARAHRPRSDAAGVQVAALIDRARCRWWRIARSISAPRSPTPRAAMACGRSPVRHAGREFEIETDCLAISGGWNPTLHLTCHMNGRPALERGDHRRLCARRRRGAGPVAAGAANGTILDPWRICRGQGGRRGGAGSAGPKAGDPTCRGRGCALCHRALWEVPRQGPRAWLDFCQ